MNALRLLTIDCPGIGSAMHFLIGTALLILPACASELDSKASGFIDDPRAHRLYDQMIEAIASAKSLSFTSRYELERGSKDKFKTACTYRVWLKKPNYFRMETQSDSGTIGGVLVGDGKRLWIYWPHGRPRWSNVIESKADDETRLSSYMTKPALQGKHSIWHEVIFLGAGMGFPVLDVSRFHGHVDSIESHLDAVRLLNTEIIGTEVCDQIEVSFMDGQRRWRLWLSTRDHLPRKLTEVTRVSDDVSTTELWSQVSLNQDIPDSKFAWTPPPDWTEWKLPEEHEGLLRPGAVFLQYKHQGLVVLGINVSDDRQLTLGFLRRKRVTFPNILDTSAMAGKVCVEDYGGGTVPLNYVIDRKGAVVDAWFGASGGVRAKAALESIGLGAAKAAR